MKHGRLKRQPERTLQSEARFPRASLVPLSLSELFLWGRITRAHGLRGYVIGESFSEQPDQYNLKYFWICFPGETEAVPRAVHSIHPHTSRKEPDRPLRWWRLRIEGVEDRTAAEKWVRAELYLPRAYLPPLEEGHFYYVEAEGASVIDENGLFRGYLRSIYPGTAYDFFIVENAQGESFWIPAPFIAGLSRDTSPPTLHVKGPEGLWDPSLAKGKV
ncbi:MAG: hypothetical protein RMK19_06490 [Bacteroidia bacterium]|nr:hypothetical protein [Bacteroidia bacterium]MDW8015642.1 hypothetical protein [Bacteroidia bacterium]